ncbi:AraC family transcriptional regulator [Gordonia sp. CPCC 206044]|uniref:helix-turn-helix domain-containing protein n=1 Tax=Gordonia sp. CPCC 206044 TaxID=3140793 RepID=UPI003AF401BC
MAVRWSPTEEENRRLLRARDTIDRDYSSPLDIPALAQVAVLSPAHFIRRFRDVFGETPHRYLQRRRIERACALLRDGDSSVTDIAFAVGYGSLGTFSRTFATIIGRSPSEYRRSVPAARVPTCFIKDHARPSSFGEATSTTPPVRSKP